VVAVRPESGAVVPDWKGDAVIQFDEVIDEMAGAGGGAGGAGAISGLARQVVLSPVIGDVRVSWHRSSIHVKPAEGWKPGRVYRLELLPGIMDLRRNVQKDGRTVIFSTGGELGHATLTGTALAWVEQRTLPRAVIRAARVPDTVAYVTVADSAGGFRLAGIPAGRYVVFAINDQNNNRLRDGREAFDSALVTLDSTATVVLWTFAHDSTGARLRVADFIDSLTFRLTFSQPLAPAVPLDSTRIHVYALPDTTPVALIAVLPPALFDSIQAHERARADSLRRAQDTTARRDTSRAPPPAPPAHRQPAAPRGAAGDTTARADTTRIRALLRQRPVPFDRVVVRMAQRLEPGRKYFIKVKGATNLNGAAADGQTVLAIPVPSAKPEASPPTRPRPP